MTGEARAESDMYHRGRKKGKRLGRTDQNRRCTVQRLRSGKKDIAGIMRVKAQEGIIGREE